MGCRGAFMSAGKFFVVGTPIGNLGDMTIRAIDTLKSVDLIFCEDTRHSLKLLNHFEIRKPLKSSPYFKERKAATELLASLEEGKSVAFISDAGMPGVSDPGATLVAAVREKGIAVEVIGGVSSLTHFIAGLGVELETFRFTGFLPSRGIDRERFFDLAVQEPTIFFESPHRIETTLEILNSKCPQHFLILAKELSKISEGFYRGTPSDLVKQIKSFKGEWIGCIFPLGREGLTA